MPNDLRDIKIQIALENGRFDLENVGQGQRIIYHFSQKNKPNNVTKKYLRLSEK